MFYDDMSCTLLIMLTFTYKYIIITVVSLFIGTSVLLLFSHSHFTWYVYTVPCVLSYFILANRANKIKIYKEQLIIESLYQKKSFDFENIQQITVFKDPFFYGKTIGLRIHLKNGKYNKYYIGTFLTSQLSELNTILSNKIKL